MNQESLNGSHGAMLAAHNSSNSDVQLPYRFPVCEETHSKICEENCLELADEDTIVEAAQVSQDAQAGRNQMSWGWMDEIGILESGCV